LLVVIAIIAIQAMGVEIADYVLDNFLLPRSVAPKNEFVSTGCP
jgi:hypothetical protein